jgi:hypothetical protein
MSTNVQAFFGFAAAINFSCIATRMAFMQRRPLRNMDYERFLMHASGIVVCLTNIFNADPFACNVELVTYLDDLSLLLGSLDTRPFLSIGCY